MNTSDAPLIRRATIALLLTQSLSSAAFLTSSTVNPLVIASLSGQDALAGLPTALVLVGASLAAYPAGQVMGRLGRRYGLMIGGAVGLAGALISGASVVTGQLPLFLIGLILLGAGRGSLDQGRYGAAEINPPERRARSLSIVIFGGTVGAILGPALVAPASNLAGSAGLPPLAGPYFATAFLTVILSTLVFIALNMDLRGIARRVADQDKATQSIQQRELQASLLLQPKMTILDLLRKRDSRLALLTMVCGQATMVMMMAIISLHLTHHNHDLSDVSLVTSAHVLGMFLFSPIVGYLADRIGHRTMVFVSALVLGAGCIIAPLSLMTPWIALALFMIGLGWSGCYITGSALLTDALAVHERARMQGANETLVNITSAVGGLSSGVLLQAFGFETLSMISLGIALLPLLLILLTRPAALLPEPVTAG